MLFHVCENLMIVFSLCVKVWTSSKRGSYGQSDFGIAYAAEQTVSNCLPCGILCSWILRLNEMAVSNRVKI